MAFSSNARISAIGSYVPNAVLSNADMEKLVDTNDEWIVRRTGIEERRKAADDEFTSDLAIAALKDMERRYPGSVQGADAILVATTTPDMPFPSVASQVQRAFGLANCFAIDVSAACAGFVSALQLANGLALTGAYRKIIVIGAETLTKITDYSDRSTCILFGDGAGAVLVETDGSGSAGDFLASSASTDGNGGFHVYATGLSGKGHNGEALTGDGKIVQNGREVLKWALTEVPDNVQRLVESTGRRMEDLDWFVPHSANLRMIKGFCERMAFPEEKTLQSIVNNGNTSAASIPLALDAAVKEGKLDTGHIVALYGFGSGLTQSGLLVRWSIPRSEG